MTTTKNTRSRNLWLAGGALALLAFVAATAVAVPRHLTNHRLVGAHGGPFAGPVDPALAHQRLDFIAGWVLDRIDATPEQEADVDALLSDALDRLFVVGADRFERRAEVRALLTADRIDRVALEAHREEMIVHADEASRILLDTIANVAEELTPEQRARLAELADRFHGRG